MQIGLFKMFKNKWKNSNIIFIVGLTFAGQVGLAVTQAMALTSVLQYGVRMLTDVINDMLSVERVLEYTDLEQEPKPGILYFIYLL